MSAVPSGFKKGSGTKAFEYWYVFLSVDNKIMLLALRRKKKGGRSRPYTVLSESLLKNLRNEDDGVRREALAHQKKFAFPFDNDQIEMLVRKHWPDLVIAGAVPPQRQEERVSA